jgi:tRNA nucleotidyltransferase (CCA-adding enzyme)
LGALGLGLPAGTRPSEAATVLDRLAPAAVAAAVVLRPEQRNALEQYLTAWRFVRPALSGDDLVALGLKPGPEFRRWLGQLRAARLDGAELDRDGELALVRQWARLEDQTGLEEAHD